MNALPISIAQIQHCAKIQNAKILASHKMFADRMLFAKPLHIQSHAAVLQKLAAIQKSRAISLNVRTMTNVILTKHVLIRNVSVHARYQMHVVETQTASQINTLECAHVFLEQPEIHCWVAFNYNIVTPTINAQLEQNVTMEFVELYVRAHEIA